MGFWTKEAPLTNSPNTPTAPPLGVMDASYAQDRARKPHLVFRYRCRAEIAARMYERFRSHEQPPRVLDFGSADGRALTEAHTRLNAAESIGIEYDRGLISHAKLPGGCCVLQGDVTKPHEAAPDGTFDLITALAVLEHVADAVGLAQRVFAALKPGGVFVATCPYPLWDVISGTLRLHKDEHHAKNYTRARFEEFANAGGLTPLRYQRFMLAPVGFLPYLRIVPPISTALAIDAVIAPIPLLNLTMVNQVFAARKPLTSPS